MAVIQFSLPGKEFSRLVERGLSLGLSENQVAKCLLYLAWASEPSDNAIMDMRSELLREKRRSVRAKVIGA